MIKIIKERKKSANHFCGTIETTIENLRRKFGVAPVQGSIEDKVQNVWCLEYCTDFYNGDREKIYIEIYDWKEHRIISNDEVISFHVGCSQQIPMGAVEEIKDILNID